jgi:hypothetical protein
LAFHSRLSARSQGTGYIHHVRSIVLGLTRRCSQIFELADTTFFAYRKKRGGVVLHLRSRLLIHTDASFRLSAYLKMLRCWIRLLGYLEYECDSVAYGEYPACKFDGRSMLHDFWITARLPHSLPNDCVADLRLFYHLSFTGHSSEEPELLHRRVPVIRRFSYVSLKWPDQRCKPTARFMETRSLQARLASGG